MAKSKKKKVKKQGPPKPKNKTHTLCFKPSKDTGKIDVEMLCGIPDINGLDKNIKGPVYISNEPKDLHFASRFDEEIEKSDKGDKIKAELLEIKNLIQKQCDVYLRNTTDLEQSLNIYDTETNPVTDTIDLREYMNLYFDNQSDDPIKSVRDIINKPDFTYDPSWFWSTSEYVDIIITPNLMYKLQRVLYDTIHNEVRYCIVEYQRFRLGSDVYIQIPTLMGIMQFAIVTVDNKSKTGKYIDNYRPLDNNKAYFDIKPFYDKMGRRIIDTYSNDYGDNFKTLHNTTIGYDNFMSIYDDLQKFHRHLDTSAYKALLKTIYAINKNDLYVNPDSETQQHFLSPSIISSALLLTNYLLKNKKLSKPVKSPKTQNIIHEFDIGNNNQPERKTRVLGQSIKITSNKRPDAPAIDKIIKYHTPEWERKEHLRKLKSGKIVTVRAAKCKRKSMNGQESKITKTAVDYKIMPESPD